MIETLNLQGMDISSLIVNFLYVAAGFIIHVAKKYFSDDINPKRYLKEHAGRTGVAISGGIAAYFSLIAMQPEAGPEAFIAIGYMMDSIFNRAPESDIVKERIKNLEDRENANREVEEDYARLKEFTKGPDIKTEESKG